MCVSIGGLPRTFHILEDGIKELKCDQRNGDVYFTSFSLSVHAISRRAAQTRERDTVVIFRPLVDKKEAKTMRRDLYALSQRPGVTSKHKAELRTGVADFYGRLAQFIQDGPIAP